MQAKRKQAIFACVFVTICGILKQALDLYLLFALKVCLKAVIWLLTFINVINKIYPVTSVKLKFSYGKGFESFPLHSTEV